MAGCGIAQARFIQHAISKQHDVDIDVARTFDLASADVPSIASICNTYCSNCRGRQFGVDRGHAVQKPGLVGTSTGWVSYKEDTASKCPAGQALDRRAQIGGAIAQIRSQRQVGCFAHRASFVSSSRNNASKKPTSAPEFSGVTEERASLRTSVSTKVTFLTVIGCRSSIEMP